MNNDHADSNPVAGKRNGTSGGGTNRNATAANPPAMDFWPFAETLLLHWRWPVVAATMLTLGGLAFGLWHWQSTYTAPAQLVAYNSPNATEIFGGREISQQILLSLLRAPELLEAAGAQAAPPVSATALATRLNLMPDRGSDIIVAAITDTNPETALALANLYAHEAVHYTAKMQADSAAEMDRFFSLQLTNVDNQISGLNQQASRLSAPSLQPSNTTSSLFASLSTQLQTAREELVALLAKYTEAHPLVQEKRAEIAALENMLPANAMGTATNPAALAAMPGESDPQVIRSKLEVLERTRLDLLDKQQAVEAFEANPPGYCRLLVPAMPKDVVAHSCNAKVASLSMFAGMLGLFAGTLAVLLMEISDDRLKTPADVRRVTRLPVLAIGGDLSRMDELERYDWAFRTWTRLQGRLSPSPNHGLVLGVTSAGGGEGRSTWLQLLGEAASLLGFRVLTITTRPSPRKSDSQNVITNGAVKATISSPSPKSNSKQVDTSTTLTANTNILATPAEVTDKLTGPNSQPVVHIPLPGWVWNLERRKQWQEALSHWSKIENVVILVELPPASVPEAVLLAENLPNVIWLTASGEAAAAETSEKLETLRDARCHLSGAVLNRAPKAFLRKRFARWVTCAVFAAGFHALTSFSTAAVLQNTNAVTVVGQPADTPAQAAARAALAGLQGTNNTTAINATPTTPETGIPEANAVPETTVPAKRAHWQEHFTLGAGDVLDFSLYGEPTLTQLNVPISPDGRVNFLEAQGVMAAGLTIDELRSRLDEELAKYRRAPHTIITPVAFNSKKYFLLGSVVRAGAFTLDRPTTIVEAIARARGIETALQQRNLVEIADLQRSFLVRQGRRMPVDFEKLFLHGDLSQNLPLAPDDYLFISPADLKQVYVVGEVQRPGPAAYNPNMSTIGAIAVQGGFTERAWKQKILVVRGSLSHPQTFIVDANDVLSARTPDFKLEPNDIIYVHYRPWVRAEEILDLAATAFVQSAVIVWTGGHVGPIISTPIIN